VFVVLLCRPVHADLEFYTEVNRGVDGPRLVEILVSGAHITRVGSIQHTTVHHRTPLNIMVLCSTAPALQCAPEKMWSPRLCTRLVAYSLCLVSHVAGVRELLRELYGVLLDPQHVLELDSSTTSKFSRCGTYSTHPCKAL
jgi:hypothetical protein